jgi:hypothetical protein
MATAASLSFTPNLNSKWTTKSAIFCFVGHVNEPQSNKKVFQCLAISILLVWNVQTNYNKLFANVNFA